MTIDAPTVLKYEVQETRGKIIYGRVYYTDIFRANRSSGFIMRIGSAGAVPFEAAAEYTAWD
jgi:hypothetical protein